MKTRCLAAILVLISAAAGAAESTAPPKLKAIVGATVVNIGGGAPVENAVVLIEGEKIKSIGPAGTEVPAGAEVIRAAGTWLIPGLMNMHVHLGLKLPGRDRAALAEETTAAVTLRMMVNARESLKAGVTTIRMPGSEGNTGVAVRDAIARGEYEGPRIFTAGGVTMTAGHGSRPGQTYNDGPYEMVKTARMKIREGQDWIKIAISGGVATDGDGGITESLMTPEEMRAVIDASHRFGVKVAAHSGSTLLKKMAKQGTWYVPTIMVTHPGGREYFQRIGSPPWYLERRESIGKQHWVTLKTAIEEKVRIALGTDQMPFEPNDGTTSTVREAEAYVEAGMTPLQALRSATIDCATMLDANDEIGSVEAGKYADILAVTADPTRNISALRNIAMIMKGGTVYRNDLASAPERSAP
jgi:imidazolonepropionase-like amidohydrolase